jgi:hypothetical protein
MAGWRYSVSEVLIIAKALNATFVEPCIRKGELVNCSEPHNIKLSDLFSMDKIKEFHPLIVSYAAFQNVLGVRTITHTTNNNPDAKSADSAHYIYRCQTANEFEHEYGCGKDPYILNQWRNHSSSLLWLEQAVARSQSQSQSQPTVVQINGYFKWGWLGMKYEGRPIIPHGQNGKRIINNVALKHLQFNSDIYDFVDMILKEAGIKDEKYSVIQWRGEIHTLDYISCAQHIVTARDIMREDNNGNDNNETSSTPFILISSLNRDESFTWKKTSTGSVAQEALTLLLDTNGFLKLESLVQKHLDFIKDPIFLAAADLILAQKANEFATCDKSCIGTKAICAQCGLQGNFVLLAEDLRTARDKNSISCWPERNKEGLGSEFGKV